MIFQVTWDRKHTSRTPSDPWNSNGWHSCHQSKGNEINKSKKKIVVGRTQKYNLHCNNSSITCQLCTHPICFLKETMFLKSAGSGWFPNNHHNHNCGLPLSFCFKFFLSFMGIFLEGLCPQSTRFCYCWSFYHFSAVTGGELVSPYVTGDQREWESGSALY